MESLEEKPIVIEDLVGKAGSDILVLLDNSDKVNRATSITLVSQQLDLFHKALILQYEALAFAAEHAEQWTRAEQIVVAMACRISRQLRAACELMLYGFWAEVQVLERSIHEALTREWFYYKYPKRADKWFQQGNNIKQSEVDHALAKEEDEEDKEILKTLRDEYSRLSQHTHPNIEAIQLETWDGDSAIGRKGILAGPITRSFFPVQFHALLITALTATQMLGIVGLYEATGTWKQDTRELADSILALEPKPSL